MDENNIIEDFDRITFLFRDYIYKFVETTNLFKF